MNNLRRYYDNNNLFRIYSLILFLILPSFNYFVNYIIMQLYGKTLYFSYLSYSLLTLAGIYCFFKYTFNNKYRLLFTSIIAFNIILFLYFNPSIRTLFTEEWYNPVYSKFYAIFIYCIPALFLTVKIPENELSLVKAIIFPISITSVILGITAFSISLVFNSSREYMSFSYHLLYPSLLCLSCRTFSNIKRRIIHYLCFIIGSLGVITTVFIGSRGAMLCICIFLIFEFMSLKIKTIYRIICVLIFLCLGLILRFNFENIIYYLVDISDSIGIHKSRVLYRILDESFFIDDGRSWRFEAIVKGIKYFPIGYGLLGDWYCTWKYGDYATYSHNIILEIFCDFGIVGGLIFFYYFIRGSIINMKTINANFFIVMLSFGFIRLLFSSSFVWNTEFYILNGLIIRYAYSGQYSWCANVIK